MRAVVRLAAVLALAGCAQQTPPAPSATGSDTKPVMSLTPVSFAQLPGWQEDHPAQALAPFLLGCAQMGGSLGGGGLAATLGGTSAAWQVTCQAAHGVPAGDDAAARTFFESSFQPYAIASNGSDTGLFTGYYEPEVRGARSPQPGFDVPLLAKPADLVQLDLGAFAPDLKGRKITGRVQSGSFVPYYDRTEIVDGALRGKRLELLWLANPVDAFFLQIQGSGRVRLDDNRVVRVTYAGQNGRPYVAIGKVLADQGAIPLPQVSMQSIRAWLESHPGEAAAVMARNPSYVFFRELTGVRPEDGPPGALGAALTPMRSVAVDRSFVPLGAPLFIDTTDPIDGSKIQRMMVAQDTGGAIKGPVRADVFFGWTPDAENRAGRMRQQGHDFILLPKSVPAS